MTEFAHLHLHTEYSLWTAVMGWTAWRDGSSLLQPRKDRHFHRSPIDAGKRDRDQEFGLGLRDIDRRFPAQVMDLCGYRLEELAMQSLGAINQLTSPGPH